MKIAICGSMSFAKEMKEASEKLAGFGHEVFLPEGVEDYIEGRLNKISASEGAKRKAQFDLIRGHYRTIEKSDAVLILNYDKKGIKNYVGGNSFLEMGFAHILNKPIYLLNEIPEIEFIEQEIEAMSPIVLDGDLAKIVY